MTSRVLEMNLGILSKETIGGGVCRDLSNSFPAENQQVISGVWNWFLRTHESFDHPRTGRGGRAPTGILGQFGPASLCFPQSYSLSRILEPHKRSDFA